MGKPGSGKLIAPFTDMYPFLDAGLGVIRRAAGDLRAVPVTSIIIELQEGDRLSGGSLGFNSARP